MTIRYNIALAIVAVMWPMASAGEESTDPCVALLLHGIYNYAYKNSSDFDFKDTMSKVSDSVSKSKGSGGKAGIKLGKIELKAGGKAHKAVTNVMSREADATSVSDDDLQVISKEISKPGADAYTQCVAGRSRGLHVQNINFGYDDYVFKLSLLFVGYRNSEMTSVSLVKPLVIGGGKDDEVTCSGRLFDLAKKKGELGLAEAGVVCKRTYHEPPINFESTDIRAYPVTLYIETGAGSISMDLPPKRKESVISEECNSLRDDFVAYTGPNLSEFKQAWDTRSELMESWFDRVTYAKIKKDKGPNGEGFDRFRKQIKSYGTKAYWFGGPAGIKLAENFYQDRAFIKKTMCQP